MARASAAADATVISSMPGSYIYWALLGFKFKKIHAIQSILPLRFYFLLQQIPLQVPQTSGPNPQVERAAGVMSETPSRPKELAIVIPARE